MVMQAQDIRVNHSGVPDGNVQVSELASKASGRFGETVVRECTYGIMTLESCEAAHFTHCDFFGNKEYTLIESHTSIGTVFEDCRMYANWGDAALFSFDREFMLLGCAIYHPTENLGTMNFCEQPSASQPNFFSPIPTTKTCRAAESALTVWIETGRGNNKLLL